MWLMTIDDLAAKVAWTTFRICNSLCQGFVADVSLA